MQSLRDSFLRLKIRLLLLKFESWTLEKVVKQKAPYTVDSIYLYHFFAFQHIQSPSLVLGGGHSRWLIWLCLWCLPRASIMH